MESQTIDQVVQNETRQTVETPKPSFVDVMDAIRRDATVEPKKYLSEVFVPHGGE